MGRIGTVLALFAVVGCSVGTKWTWEQVRQLKPGMTLDEVTAILGPPYQLMAGMPAVDPGTGKPTGSQTVATWVHTTGLAGVHSLSLTFGPDGRLLFVPMGGGAGSPPQPTGAPPP